MGYVIEVRHPTEGSGYYVPLFGDGWARGGLSDAHRFLSKGEAEAQARRLQQDDPAFTCRVLSV